MAYLPENSLSLVFLYSSLTLDISNIAIAKAHSLLSDKTMYSLA